MKQYKVYFIVQIIEGDDLYQSKKVIDLQIKENLPVNCDAHKYLRSRISEELSRNFSSMSEPLDNKTAEALNEADPLEERFF